MNSSRSQDETQGQKLMSPFCRFKAREGFVCVFITGQPSFPGTGVKRSRIHRSGTESKALFLHVKTKLKLHLAIKSKN